MTTFEWPGLYYVRDINLGTNALTESLRLIDVQVSVGKRVSELGLDRSVAGISPSACANITRNRLR